MLYKYKELLERALKDGLVQQKDPSALLDDVNGDVILYLDTHIPATCYKAGKLVLEKGAFICGHNNGITSQHFLVLEGKVEINNTTYTLAESINFNQGTTFQITNTNDSSESVIRFVQKRH